MYVSKCRFACVYAHAWLSVCLTNTALACGLSISFQCICVWVLLVWFGCSPPCPWHRYCVIPSMHPCHHFFYTCTFYYRFPSVHGTAKWILVYFYACVIIYHTIFCRLYHGELNFNLLFWIYMLLLMLLSVVHVTANPIPACLITQSLDSTCMRMTLPV